MSTATSGLRVNWETNNAKPKHTTHDEAVAWGMDPERGNSALKLPSLTRTSERVPLLDDLFEHALRLIGMTADGATTNYAPTEFLPGRADRTTAMGRALAESGGVKAKAAKGTVAPRSGLADEIAWLEQAYTTCRTHRARLTVIKGAQDIGRRLLIAPKADPKLVKGTREYRERVAADTRPCRTVAQAYSLSLRDVVAYRKEFKNA